MQISFVSANQAMVRPRGHCRMIAYRVCKPTSPSCFEPALPTQTTLQRSGLGMSSSRTSSTTWPRLRSKLARSRKPSFEESRMRQGTLFGLRSKLMIRLARLFDTKRFERRALRTGKLGILSTTDLQVVMVRPDYFHLKCGMMNWSQIRPLVYS